MSRRRFDMGYENAPRERYEPPEPLPPYDAEAHKARLAARTWDAEYRDWRAHDQGAKEHG